MQGCRVVALALLPLLAPAAVAEAPHYLAVDVPARLGGTDYAINQVIRASGGAIYAAALTLPADHAIAGLHLRSTGSVLLSFRSAVDIGGTPYEARDVLEKSGATHALHFDGSSEGVPGYGAIDAILLDAAGRLVLSFDVPTRIGTVDYGPSDLVRWQGGGAFTLAFDGAAAGIPLDANVVGAAETDEGTLVLAFDAPVTLGTETFLPGDLVRYAGGQFTLQERDTSWPLEARIADFAFPPSPGSVPDGSPGSGAPLTVTRAGTDLALSWGAACQAAGTDYAVYEGTLGSWYGHAPATCTTGGALATTVTPASGSTYYLVVPLSADVEGSYGRSSAGSERPQGSGACLTQWIGSCP